MLDDKTSRALRALRWFTHILSAKTLDDVFAADSTADVSH